MGHWWAGGLEFDPSLMRNLLLVSVALLAAYVLRRSEPVSIGSGAPALPTAHFTLEERTTTNTGLPNVPSRAQKANLALLADKVLEPLRAQFGPLRITSGFRSPAVNSAVNGSSTSSHMDGFAADLYSMAGKSAATMAAWLYGQPLIPLRQVIVEKHTGHLHIDMQPPGEAFRREFLETSDGRNYEPWRAANV